MHMFAEPCAITSVVDIETASLHNILRLVNTGTTEEDHVEWSINAQATAPRQLGWIIPRRRRWVTGNKLDYNSTRFGEHGVSHTDCC